MNSAKKLYPASGGFVQTHSTVQARAVSFLDGDNHDEINKGLLGYGETAYNVIASIM